MYFITSLVKTHGARVMEMYFITSLVKTHGAAVMEMYFRTSLVKPHGAGVMVLDFRTVSYQRIIYENFIYRKESTHVHTITTERRVVHDISCMDYYTSISFKM